MCLFYVVFQLSSISDILWNTVNDPVCVTNKLAKAFPIVFLDYFILKIEPVPFRATSEAVISSIIFQNIHRIHVVVIPVVRLGTQWAVLQGIIWGVFSEFNLVGVKEIDDFYRSDFIEFRHIYSLLLRLFLLEVWATGSSCTVWVRSSIVRAINPPQIWFYYISQVLLFKMRIVILRLRFPIIVIICVRHEGISYK